ncbi:hypothetical protein K438DRAFT_1971487 [Mycena galopus ATCC 62051]|nr:hypothetical protein K438DRAFT_1971487 [Mycena galopus ATCC 62051]
MPTSNGPDSDIYPRNAPPATKAQTPPTPASHNSVSAVQTIAQTAISRVPHSPPPLKRRRIETAVKVKLEEVPSVLPPRAANSPPPIRIEPERRAPSPPPADQEPPSILPPRARNPPSIRIKQERRTPSPSPEAPPRLSATSGSKRYWPVPNNCKRAVDPQFHENRQAWLRRECAVLKDLGLKVVKYFFRDDGMVIEWQTRNSDQPVWLDTLRPVQQRPRLPVPAGQEIIDLDHDEEPPPPTPIAVMQDAVPAGREIIDIDADSEVEPLSPRPSSPAPIAEEDLQQLSLDFIRRYICTFDHNRDALLSAYSEDAFFSFRDNNFARLTHFTIQPKGPSVSQSKPGTMPKLLPKNYRFSPRNGELHIDYDTVVFEPDSDSPNNIPNKVLLSVHGQLIGRLDERARMAIDQTFLLKRNVGVGVGAGGGTGGASARASEVWPLVVISHQMVVRDTPWVRWTGNLEDLTA